MPRPIGAISYVVLAPIPDFPVEPLRCSDLASGYDIWAVRVIDPKKELDDPERIVDSLPLTLEPYKSVMIGIGISISVPPGFICQLIPRSGLAREGIIVENGIGLIDADYTGEVGVLLGNHSNRPFTIEPGMRIAQLLFSRLESPVFVEVETIDDLPATIRGIGGFGSSGYSGPGHGTELSDQARAELDIRLMISAQAAADNSTCVRGCPLDANGRPQRDETGRLVDQDRKYGCLFAKGSQIIATGFNTQFIGSESCAEVGCLRDLEGIPSGEQLDVCRAIHAETMAIAVAAREGISVENSTMVVNAAPCIQCAKTITGLEIAALVVLKGEYGNNGLEIVEKAGVPIRFVEQEALRQAVKSTFRLKD